MPQARRMMGWGLVFALSAVTAARGVFVTPGEMAEAKRWVSAKFEGMVQTEEPKAGLRVLANNDPVQLNARAGRPMKLADKTYSRGLYCHAVSKVVVRLPGPGKTFTAIVGVDSNEQTTGGRGSVAFSVSVAGDEAYRSPVLREGMPGVAVRVDLKGTSEFVLEVLDGGDGIACDQADWADARVVLADGQSLWLGELPILDGSRPPYTTEPPFSFVYDARPSSEFLAGWEVKREKKRLDERRIEHALTWTDPKTALVVKCIGVEYGDFPTIEWTITFKNTGNADTPIIEKIQAIDTVFGGPAQGEFVLRSHTGDLCTKDSFQPHVDVLAAKSEKRIANSGGRPTQAAFPYFNVTWPGDGAVVVLSWAGQWATTFSRGETSGLRVSGGQELTHFRLHADEQVRGPMAVVQFYKGDWLRAQNVWRKWMLAHSMPRPGGKLPPQQLAACSSHQFGEMINADTKSQIFFVDRYLEEGLKLDYWWMDAGWYWNKSGWWNTGTWEVDTNRFPKGLREVSDHAHAKDVRIIVWFEPERVTPGTWLYDKHPEWLLGKDGEVKLLNMGNPQAVKWVTDHVNKLIDDQGIDLYRQDYNIDPLPYWRAADTEGRQGITEIRYVEGYFAYWDGLLAKHPNMLIDSCASGGRRNDLETLRRAVPLLRSDYIIEPVGNQGHTYALSLWFPYFGTGTGAMDAYGLRSVMCPHFTACFDMRRKDLNYESARQLLGQWRKIGPCFFGDYYPLTPYSLTDDDWIGWQFNRPEEGDGFVQVFRRAGSAYRAADLKMHGLNPEKKYAVTNLDTDKEIVASGEDLMGQGLPTEITTRPGAGLYSYRVVP
ncbi:MAG: NPCBM/NEW2 domain-containing protein [Phycisphaerae bacterium]|nr:NPCBM/NEW2 domain-containing protein [Phycisphaerae bacterium]